MSDHPDVIDRDPFRARLLKYTRQAWGMLPPLDRPKILDIGCGSGLPTIELARWSGGTVVGLDADPEALRRLMDRAASEGLQDRIAAVHSSFLDIRLPSEEFDVIWAEGVLNIIGFERGLREWHRLLRPRGFLVAHDEAAGLEQKLSSVHSLGYELIGHFSLPTDAWWVDYYLPLMKEAEHIAKGRGDAAVQAALAQIKEEADRCRSGSEAFRSVFIVLRRR